MLDARIWLILALIKWPDSPIKFYISHFPKSRGSFFKAKLALTDLGIVEAADKKRGYLVFHPARAAHFLMNEYPGLGDLTGLTNRPTDLPHDPTPRHGVRLANNAKQR